MRTRIQRGTLEKRGKKRAYWYGRWEIITRDAEGNPIRRQTGAHLGFCSDTTKTQAQQKLEQEIFKSTGSAVNASDKVTLQWFWENRFLPARESGWSEATRKGNKVDWDCYVGPGLGSLSLADIEPFVMQKHFNDLADRKFVKSVVQKSKTLLSSVLSYAADLKFLPANPMIGTSGRHTVRMPKCIKHPKPTIAIDQAAQLIALVQNRKDKLILILAMHYGMSAEEVFGLTWDCIDGSYVHIRNVAWRGKLYRNTVKRETRRRSLPLNPELSTMIAEWKEESGGEGSALVFPGRDGEHPMWAGVWLQKHITPIAKPAGIPKVTFQILRRSFSTENLASDPKSVQAIMGHAKPDMTANIYAQSVEKKVRTLLSDQWTRLGLGGTDGVQ